MRSANEVKVFHESGTKPLKVGPFQALAFWHKKPSEVTLQGSEASPVLTVNDGKPYVGLKAIFKRLLIGGTALIALLFVLIISTVLYAHSLEGKAMKNVALRGQNLAGKNEADVRKIITDAQEKYAVTVKDGSKTLGTYRPTDVGIVFSTEQTLSLAMQANQGLPLYKKLFSPGKVDVDYSFTVDQKKMDQFVATLVKSQTIAPKDAQLNIVAGEVVLTPEVVGQEVGVEKAQEKLVTSARTGVAVDLLLEQRAVQPKILQVSLMDGKKKAQALIASSPTITVLSDSFTPNKKTVGGWISVVTDQASGSTEVDVDPAEVSSYVDAVSDDYVQPPKAQLVTTGADGQQRILTTGRNGTEVINRKQIADQIVATMRNNQPKSHVLQIENAQYKVITAQEYDKWIEVDTTTHRMYAYEKDKLVRTFLVSTGAAATPTVLGEYKIQNKVRKQDMKGNNVDGTKYLQPNVEFVNYFYADYAIHGNYWRPVSVFGNVNTSHGCVGLPNSEAQFIYEWAPIGTTVIVHQ
jgi:lipoprotein-anchoring transpeptidase ErfK/SrfK